MGAAALLVNLSLRPSARENPVLTAPAVKAI